MHITLDLDQYMDSKHDLYEKSKSMLFNKNQWKEIIKIVRDGKKELMLLLNDIEAINFGLSEKPEYVEIHSICLNDLFMLEYLKNNIKKQTNIVLGVGGSTVEEIKNAISYLNHEKIILMFGFQNYPTVYEDVNLNKIHQNHENV